MGDSTDDKPVSRYPSVRPEHILAVTAHTRRNELLELYRNSDIAPGGSLILETTHPDRILRQPVLLEAKPEQYTLLLRKVDASGKTLAPATWDNTTVYLTGIKDHAEAMSTMAQFEEQNRIAPAKMMSASKLFSGLSAPAPAENALGASLGGASGRQTTPSPRTRKP
jgi:hypothetical protein